MNTNTYCLLLLLQLFVLRLPAQDGVRYLGIENGLSNNAVTQICQDNRGFMWFGTYDGLNRYDGYKFKIFRNHIGDSSSLADNNIYRIENAGDNGLWIGGRKGLSLFNPLTETFTIPKYQSAGGGEKSLTDNILAIKTLAQNQVLVGTENSGLFRFNTRTAKGIPVLFRGSAAYEVTALAADTALQRYWVFVRHAGLCLYHAGDHSLQLVTPSISNANSLTADQQGNVWLGTDAGLFKYNTAARSFSGNYLPCSSKVVNVCADAQGVLWIACDGNGIFLLQPLQDKAAPLSFAGKQQGLSSNAVYAIYEDKENRKWIGTLRGGINIIDARKNPFELHAFSTANNFGHINNFIFSFCEANDGNIWIGTDGAGLKYWNRKTRTCIAYIANAADKNAISSNFITSVIRDTRNNTWIGTWFGGINRYDAAAHAFRHYPCYNTVTGNIENNVWILYEDRQRTLWASTCNNGTLYRYDTAANAFTLFDARLVNMQCLGEDRQGGFWGGNYTSLVKIDPVNKRHLYYNTGYPVRCVREDKHGNFWVGTDGGGLLLFNRNTGRFIRYTDADGLSSNAILQMLEDKQGNLWISTFNGLVCFDTEQKSCRNFMQSDGLQSNQFTYKAAGMLASGEFMFGGIRGFNIFYPDSVCRPAVMAPLLLTGIRINNQPVADNTQWITQSNAGAIEEITVPYDKAAVSLDYAALEYTTADKINYAYRLEGWDKDWNNAGELRTANYTRLQEGSYLFSIRATNAAGIWSSPVQTIRIVVLPPWYRSWWAYIAYILFIVSGLYVYLRYTTRQQRLKYEVQLAHLETEKERELHEKKLSFFTHVSHEFRTPLTLIINPVKELLAVKQDLPEHKTLNTVYRNARRLLSLVDQLLLFRKADSEEDRLNITRLSLSALCNEVYLCFTQQARLRNIQYVLHTPANNIELLADGEKLEIALFNLLSNAFKFTPDGGAISVTLTKTQQDVQLTITDTGCGIDPAMGNRVFEKFRQAQGTAGATGFGIGLYLVKQFVEKHQGKVSYTSTRHQGTSFVISLPGNLVHVPANGSAPVSGAIHALLEELMEEAPPTEETQLPVLPHHGQTAEEILTDKKSIVLVDDNEDILRYLQQLFEKQFIVHTAPDGLQGLDMIQQQLPDLVISDIHMRGMDGLELCRKIKQADELCHIPVILLTASSAADIKLKGIADGADDYITKPFDQEFLLVKVNNIIKSRNVLQEYFFDRITLKPTTARVPAGYQEFLRRCIDIVEENIDKEDFSIKKFGAAIGMSHSALYKKVKSISGQSVNAFIRSIRLRRAAVLMLRQQLTISQAAFQVGIGDPKYFREQFFKLFGMNPSDYVKKYRNSFNGDLNIINRDV